MQQLDRSVDTISAIERGNSFFVTNAMHRMDRKQLDTTYEIVQALVKVGSSAIGWPKKHQKNHGQLEPV